MATNVGYEILVATAATADKKAEVLQRVLQVLSYRTTAVTYVVTYSAGTSSVNQASISVGGSSPDFGIRVTMDSAVVGTGEVPVILRQLIQCLECETITFANAASYTAGDRAYNVTIAVT
jgi:hypothetical protein